MILDRGLGILISVKSSLEGLSGTGCWTFEYLIIGVILLQNSLVHDSSIGSSESLSDRTSSFKIEFKISFYWYWYSSVSRKHRGLVLEGFIDESQNAVGCSEMLSTSVQNYENHSTDKARCFFTITAEIHARSLVNFYCQHADRHMNLKFTRRVSQREWITRQSVIVKNKLMSVFNTSVLLLTMNFVITLSK